MFDLVRTLLGRRHRVGVLNSESQLGNTNTHNFTQIQQQIQIQIQLDIWSGQEAAWKETPGRGPRLGILVGKYKYTQTQWQIQLSDLVSRLLGVFNSDLTKIKLETFALFVCLHGSSTEKSHIHNKSNTPMFIFIILSSYFLFFFTFLHNVKWQAFLYTNSMYFPTMLGVERDRVGWGEQEEKWRWD